MHCKHRRDQIRHSRSNRFNLSHETISHTTALLPEVVRKVSNLRCIPVRHNIHSLEQRSIYMHDCVDAAPLNLSSEQAH